MRKPVVNGGLWFSYGLNLLMNFEGLVLFGILFVCHFLFGIPLWIAWLALGLWIVGIFLVTLVLSYIVGSPSPRTDERPKNTPTTHYSSRGDGQKFKDDNESGD